MKRRGFNLTAARRVLDATPPLLWSDRPAAPQQDSVERDLDQLLDDREAVESLMGRDSDRRATKPKAATAPVTAPETGDIPF